MPLIGAHVSAAGGVSNAPLNAHKEQCETFQFFVSSPQTYRINALAEEQVTAFKAHCKELGFKQYFVHAPYLVNFASTNNRVRYGSITLIRKTLEEANKLGVTGVMFHTGTANGNPDKATAMKKAIEALNKVLDGYTGTTKLLIENAAGSGQTLGVTFEEVAELFHGIQRNELAGVCLDTQHSFASGYDWRDKKCVDEALRTFDKLIGTKHLLVIQANDSKVDCGANKDRHEHIADGFMGEKAFSLLLHHPKLKSKPFILETEPEKRAEDIATLKRLRGV